MKYLIGIMALFSGSLMFWAFWHVSAAENANLMHFATLEKEVMRYPETPDAQRLGFALDYLQSASEALLEQSYAKRKVWFYLSLAFLGLTISLVLNCILLNRRP